MEKEHNQETFQSFELSEPQARNVLEKAQCTYTDTSVKKFEKGMINDVFAVGNEYVVKVNTGHPDLPKLKREADVMSAMYENGIPTPRVYAFDDSGEILPYPYLVMELMEGELLSEYVTNLDEKEKKDMTEQLGKMLGRIHSTDYTQNEKLNTPEWTNVHSTSEKVASRLPEIKETGLLTETELQKVELFYSENEKRFASTNRHSVQHNNFAADNILMKEGELTGVIDWEWAELGDPEEELAVTLHKGVIDKDLYTEFLTGYKKVSEVEADFAERRVSLTLPYYLKVLLEVPKWTHKPEKQEEYITETKRLIAQL